MAQVPPSTPVPAAAGERRVVRLAKDGDEAARDELARSCQRTAFVFALQLTGNREDALDLSQEAMVRFFGSLARFDHRRPLRPWLLRIVRNLVRDRARRRRVRRIETLMAEPDLVLAAPPDPQPSPEATAARHEVQAMVWRALQELPDHYREVLALRDYMDLSYDEIATALSIPRGTVMSRLHRARRLLRERVAPMLRGGDNA